MKKKLFENVGGNQFKLNNESEDGVIPDYDERIVNTDDLSGDDGFPEPTSDRGEYIQLLGQITELISRLHNGVETEKQETLQKLIKIYHNIQNNKEFEILSSLIHKELQHNDEFSNSF